ISSPRASRIDLVQGLPGYDHGHHDGLSATSGHLQCYSWQPSIVFFIRSCQLGPPVPVAQFLRPGASTYFVEVDSRFRCLPLGKENTILALRVSPMVQELSRYRASSFIATISPTRDI